MIKNNVPISTVSAILGYANIITTLNIYTNVIEDTKQGAIMVMENMFIKDKSDDVCDKKCDTEQFLKIV